MVPQYEEAIIMNPSKLPGIALCLVIALPAWFLGKAFPIIGGPIISILLGMVAGQFLRTGQRSKEGFPLRPSTSYRRP